jgi:RHH-type rel operon transcriptional repressor/antitoxin RelB
MVAVRLPAALENELKALSVNTGRSKSYYIVEALTQYLENMQDRFTLENAIKEFYDGDKKTFTTEQVAAELGIKL